MQSKKSTAIIHCSTFIGGTREYIIIWLLEANYIQYIYSSFRETDNVEYVFSMTVRFTKCVHRA